MRRPFLPAVAALALASTLTGCADDDMGTVSLQVATGRIEPTASVRNGAAGQLLVSLGGDDIAIDRIQLVLRKVRLDGSPTASCPEEAEGGSACGEVRLGPVMFDLPLEQGSEPVLTALVPVGTYDRLEFQLHKPSNANEDADLVQQYPELANTSIRVTGTFNGTPFTYTSDLTEVEHVELTEPLEVEGDAEVPLTLHVDASDWFVNDAGTGLVDPSQANDGMPYESLVEQHVRASFRAFHDGDGDGAAD